MKIITILALTLSFSAQDYDCESISEYAREVMTKRQDEISIVEVMKTATDDLKRSIVVDAYQKPSFIGDKWKSNSIRSFSNDIATSCYAASM